MLSATHTASQGKRAETCGEAIQPPNPCPPHPPPPHKECPGPNLFY